MPFYRTVSGFFSAVPWSSTDDEGNEYVCAKDDRWAAPEGGMSCYVVYIGRERGMFIHRADAIASVKNFPGALAKSFTNHTSPVAWAEECRRKQLLHEWESSSLQFNGKIIRTTLSRMTLESFPTYDLFERSSTWVPMCSHCGPFINEPVGKYDWIIGKVVDGISVSTTVSCVNPGKTYNVFESP